MLDKAQTSVKNHIYSKTAPLVVSVSGGVDSMVVLNLLMHMGYVNLHVVHLHHGLRQEADEDAVFVQHFAEKRGLPFHPVSINVKELAEKQKGNIENTGRNARYTTLETIRNNIGAEWIVLGHHADDLLESQIMHIMRGSDLFGLVGFREVDHKRHLIRPLRSHSKQEIMKYALATDTPWREDHTNQDIRFKRNEIRHHIIPQLKSAFPAILEDMRELSDHVSDILETLHSNLEHKLGKDFEQQRSWPRDRIIACTEEELHYALLWILRFWKPASSYTSNTLIPRAKELSTVQSGKIIQLTKDFSLRRSFDTIDIVDTPAVTPLPEHHSRLPKMLPLGNHILHFIDGHSAVSSIVVPVSLLKNGFTLRSKQEGDMLRFETQGTSFHKSLKKFLIEKKIPVDKRDTLPLLVSNKTGEIVAILNRDIYYRHPEVSKTTHIVTVYIS